MNALPADADVFGEPGEVVAAALRRWLDAPEIPAGRAVSELRKAHLLAEVEPVTVARVFNPLNEEPAEVVAQALTEVLRQLGYAAGCSVTPSLFGGYTVKAAARRLHPGELSDPDGTVKE